MVIIAKEVNALEGILGFRWRIGVDFFVADPLPIADESKFKCCRDDHDGNNNNDNKSVLSFSNKNQAT